jgi:hypothetical protein
MPATADHVQTKEVDVPPKADKIASLIREMINREVKAGNLDPTLLQDVIENGGILQERVLPVLVKVGTIGRLIESTLLEPVTMVQTSAVEAFGATAKFKIGTQDRVKIGWLGDNFKECLLAGSSRNEIDVPARNLRVHRLRRNSLDGSIIEELGGEAIVESSLAQMWAVMMKQGTGQAGDLLVSGYANIFYIRDDENTLWAVDCYWHSGSGWHVVAYSITDQSDWFADDQVFTG